ncbi:NADH-quinone oxidoreductase subunit B family protein [Candidatus Magnetomonas plexicatena]|uniref:NADH-quinone oxidoreductase subunit B family protein n=1 Tax=Candidatus Magnetomonas plexicatena TaxID=2552947 RepID=UPI001C758F43|nr:NADH-quinone oxidoreductase subunit B family protein [Nitrospirales bacterium LBB_01]
MIRILRQIFRTGIVTDPAPRCDDPKITTGEITLPDSVLKRFKRSLTVREVDAGSCNGCELEIHAINNPIYNCEQFGIHFTASPRFADILLVTGPVTKNMEIALRRTYDAVPTPKLVIAVGDCGCNGGIFGESYASLGGVDKVIPVDIYIPGCPPTPTDILNGFYKIFL